MKSLAASGEYRKGEFNYQDNYSFGQNRFSFAARYGRAFNGGLSIFNRFSLGGFQQLSGYRPGELQGEAVAFARLAYYRRLAQLQNPFGKTLYAGFSMEAARIGNDAETLWKTPTKNSLGLFVGFDTLIGPLYLGYGRAKERSTLFYLFLGQP